MKDMGIVVIVIYLVIITGWVKSIIKLTECDFEPSYKAEVVYMVGSIVPPVGAVVGWLEVGR